MFANNYLNKNGIEALIPETPDPDTGMIVVIPCLREPGILQTLESLKDCTLPDVSVEIIVLINHSELASEDVQNFNNETKLALDYWVEKNPVVGIKFHVVGPIILRKKWAGAGLARKKGMDEALRRFNMLNKSDGVIVSLDADTLVEPNYLVEIAAHFKAFPKNVGATLAFEHQKDGLDAKHLEGIELYEKYLTYYKNALEYTGYPYAMFTIGSAFAVRAQAYVKRGGMNRRQAGEDFYFLQNLVHLGKVGVINKTKVYPSARLSDRVPFGTGPILKKWMEGDQDLLETYDFRSFQILRTFFQQIPELFKISHIQYIEILQKLAPELTNFLIRIEFWDDLDDLNRNCASFEAFQNRFFQKFNAFKILKCLNFLQEKYYPAANLDIQLKALTRSIADGQK